MGGHVNANLSVNTLFLLCLSFFLSPFFYFLFFCYSPLFLHQLFPFLSISLWLSLPFLCGAIPHVKVTIYHVFLYILPIFVYYFSWVLCNCKVAMEEELYLFNRRPLHRRVRACEKFEWVTARCTCGVWMFHVWATVRGLVTLAALTATFFFFFVFFLGRLPVGQGNDTFFS